MRRPTATASVALAAVIGLVGCSGSDGSSDGPRPTSTGTAVAPQSEGIDRIDIDGAVGSPITWQLPAGTQPTGPVGVTQRYIAVIQQVGAPDADLDPSAVDSIATEAPAAAARNAIADGPTQPDVSSGPVWVWLDTAEENGDRAVVKGCADVGFFQPAGAKTPAELPAKAWYTDLERVDDADGAQVWKVSRFNTGPVNDADPFEKQCPEWATHQP